jgi:hypothetical protein
LRRDPVVTFLTNWGYWGNELGRTSPAGVSMLVYRLFSHDGFGNFSLLQEFEAQDDEAAAKFVGRWPVRPLELWQSARKVKRLV